MENDAVARLFGEIAEMLELKGDNVFKIRAYEKAARIIEALPEPIESYNGRSELEAIPGIGKGISEKIKEYLESGSISFHRELLDEFPPQLIAMLRVPGLGPKKVSFLYEKAKIASIEELERAAREGKIRTLPGFGQKTEENILKGLAILRQRGGRISLGLALPLAHGIIKEMAQVPGVKAISEAGSLRRRREDIGDIDILIASLDPLSVMEAFTGLTMVREVLARGETKASVITHHNLQVDLRVVSPESYGAALQYFTGSRQHNILLRQRAEGRGLKINEYGVFAVKDGERIAGSTEEEVYRAVGLPIIPPEIRETGEEIPAAEKGTLPDLVDLRDIRGDLHAHTGFSDGINSIEEMAEGARKLGYRYLALTDHSASLKVAGGLSRERLLEKKRRIEELNALWNDFRLLYGAEVDILPDGSLDYPDELLEEMDLVIGSVHSHFRQEEAVMTARLIRALRNPHVDLIAHPSGRLIGHREEYLVDWEAFFREAAGTRTALEINSYPDRLDLNDHRARRAVQLGIPLAVNTDAHSVQNLEWMTYGVAVARRGWVEKSSVLNTWSLSDLLFWLKSRNSS
ncbi:MAG: DNA polymerase/3'-5' exonuclease PolX [bacterium]